MTNPVPPAPPQNAPDWFESLLTIAGPLFVFLIVGGSWFTATFGGNRPGLEIAAAAHPDSAGGWVIQGRVFDRTTGAPVDAYLWLIASDNIGNRFMPTGVHADAQGGFVVPPIPARLADREEAVATAVLRARKVVDSTTALLGMSTLRLSSAGRVQWVDPSPGVFVTIGVIFVLTMIIGLIHLDGKALVMRRAKYYTLVGLSFLFTFTMIASLAMGLRSVNSNSSQSEVMALGFANIYRGTYVKDQPKEWLFSLTSPDLELASDKQSANEGFGAPLWVLLVSVIGAGIFTISLLVRHIREPVNVDDEANYRTRIEELVRHQFYIFFAPLGAVVVYQVLVASGAASAQVTVALAILAAGTALNLVLDKAVTTLQGAFK